MSWLVCILMRKSESNYNISSHPLIKTKKGLKQGGISSCQLFLIIMDLLLKKIQRLNCGLTFAFDDNKGLFHHQWVFALAFADDLCLIFKVEETEQIKAIINSWYSDLELTVSDKSWFYIINEKPCRCQLYFTFQWNKIIKSWVIQVFRIYNNQRP